jgi:lysophospholipase L1-like esterase
MKQLRLLATTLALAALLLPPGQAAAQTAQTDRSRAADARTNPDRWESTIAKFEAADKANPPAPNGIVFYGSSSIVRWKLDQSFPDLKALNRGFGGSQMKDALRYVDRAVIPLKPRLVVVYEGDNDVEAGTAPNTISDQFAALATKIHAALPATKVIAISIKPSLRRDKFQAQMNEANTGIKAFCKKNAFATYLDVVTPMLDRAGKPKPELFVEDGLHMTPAGYAIWDEAIAPLLK